MQNNWLDNNGEQECGVRLAYNTWSEEDYFFYEMLKNTIILVWCSLNI